LAVFLYFLVRIARNVRLYLSFIMNKIDHLKQYGTGNSPFIVHPAQWSNATAGYIGPFFRAALSNATPMF
jgi:hypothetical protein